MDSSHKDSHIGRIVTEGGYVTQIFRCAAGWCWRIERAGEQVESGEGLDDGDAAVASAENALRRLLSRL